jgi:hypothetical protein
LNSLIRVYDQIVGLVTKIAGVIAGALILATGFMIVYEIIVRGVFNAPTEWVTEVSTYCIIIAGFLGMGVAYAGNKHIKVDLFIQHLSPKVRCWIELVTCVLAVYYSYVFVTEGWAMTMLSLEFDNRAPTTLSTPLWIPQISMPAGLLILCLQLIGTVLHDIRKIVSGQYEEKEEP